MVVIAVERPERVARDLAQPRLAADAPAADAMAVVQQLVQRFGRHGRRIVRLSLRLLDDDLELARQLVGVDDRAGVGVGLDVEALHEARRRQHRVVARVVVDRAGVEIAADGLRLLGDLADAARRRALEVHVLEHVRDADDVVGLVEVAGAHVRDDGDDRRRAVAPNQHGQSVGQPRSHDGGRVDRGQRRRRRSGHGCSR